jgi:hypothetical protein
VCAKVEAEDARRGFRAAVHFELCTHAFKMILDGARGKTEVCRNVCVRSAFWRDLEDLELAWCKTEQLAQMNGWGWASGTEAFRVEVGAEEVVQLPAAGIGGSAGSVGGECAVRRFGSSLDGEPGVEVLEVLSDGPGRNKQRRCYCPVRPAPREEGEHLGLAAGERKRWAEVESERASLRSAENRAEIGAQPLEQGYVRVGEVASPRLTNEVDQLSGRERDPGPDDMVEAKKGRKK